MYRRAYYQKDICIWDLVGGGGGELVFSGGLIFIYFLGGPGELIFWVWLCLATYWHLFGTCLYNQSKTEVVRPSILSLVNSTGDLSFHVCCVCDLPDKELVPATSPFVCADLLISMWPYQPEVIKHWLSFNQQFDELSAPVAQDVEFIFIRLNVLREVRLSSIILVIINLAGIFHSLKYGASLHIEAN